MLTRSLAFAKKRAQKIAVISKMRAEHRANMGKLAAETEARMAIADAETRARVEKQQEATKAANRKKQKEIARRLKLKRQEEKVEAEAEALRFEHKTNTVNKRLEDHEDAKMTALAARFAEQARQLAARDARNAELLKQKTMAAGSTLNLAERKVLLSEQVRQEKIDHALGRAAEAQMNYNEKMAHIQRQQRIEQQRRREAAAASNAKSNRTQSVIDAKMNLRSNSRLAAMEAVVSRAKLSAKAQIPRGGDFVPMDWMSDPIKLENVAQTRQISDACRRMSYDQLAMQLSQHVGPSASSFF